MLHSVESLFTGLIEEKPSNLCVSCSTITCKYYFCYLIFLWPSQTLNLVAHISGIFHWHNVPMQPTQSQGHCPTFHFAHSMSISHSKQTEKYLISAFISCHLSAAATLTSSPWEKFSAFTSPASGEWLDNRGAPNSSSGYAAAAEVPAFTPGIIFLLVDWGSCTRTTPNHDTFHC